tara:strand:- start:291 stop:665 length:375 start_codon:yes stop_codon:yes gene_type:complete
MQNGLLNLYKIDSTKNTIEEAQAPTGDGEDFLDFVTDHIGCEWITSVRISQNDVIYVDDAGLLREGYQGAFQVEGYPQPLVGNAIVIGYNNVGESVDVHMSIDDLKKKIKFGLMMLDTPSESRN